MAPAARRWCGRTIRISATPAATEMSSRGEHNLGQLCRKAFGREAYLIGFGTHEGEVAAASDWDGPMQIKEVQPSLPESYEHACHEAGIESFMLRSARRLAGAARRACASRGWSARSA